MFPAVVVDLGSQIRPAEAAWVLAACNAAIVQGTCEREVPAGTSPRAVAIVRLQGTRQRVRIEVGLRESERAAWSVREIVFSRTDPARERWRTVGLALATLVGEVEAARAEAVEDGGGAGESAAGQLATPSTPEAAASPSTEAPPTQEPAAPPPAPAPPAQPSAPEPVEPPLEPAPVTRVVVRERDTAPEAPPFPRHHGVFVGLGVLASPAASGGAMPWGGALRGGYSLPSGWVWLLSADYSHATFERGGYSIDTLRITPGISYRLSPSEHWSIGLGAYAGVRALRASSSSGAALQQDAWSPLAAGSLELWWQALPGAGLWAALELATIGRSTRVQGRDQVLDAVVPAADARGLVGLWLPL